jgi:HK97 family phage prohead protease
MDFERRFFAGKLELRAEADKPKQILGYGAVFNALSEDLGGFREIIEPGAFSDVLGDDVRALLNHDPNLLLGRTTAGTLGLTEDEVGLRYEITPPDTTYANDLIVSIGRKDLDQSSFAFRVAVKGETWKEPTESQPYYLRIIHKFARLFDVSPVTFPAYQATSVALRDYLQAISAGQATGKMAATEAARRLLFMRQKLELESKL